MAEQRTAFDLQPERLAGVDRSAASRLGPEPGSAGSLRPGEMSRQRRRRARSRSAASRAGPSASPTANVRLAVDLLGAIGGVDRRAHGQFPASQVAQHGHRAVAAAAERGEQRAFGHDLGAARRMVDRGEPFAARGDRPMRHSIAIAAWRRRRAAIRRRPADARCRVSPRRCQPGGGEERRLRLARGELGQAGLRRCRGTARPGSRAERGATGPRGAARWCRRARLAAARGSRRRRSARRACRRAAGRRRWRARRGVSSRRP